METLIYDKLSKGRVKCGICSHFCKIEEGKRGICNVRENKGGALQTNVYPKIIASSIDPIEKKPIFHLKPGSYSYSIASVGCNFKCAFCQNSDIAQMPSDRDGLIQGKEVTPKNIVDQAIKAGCKSISYTYTEPSVYFELAFETSKLAKESGLLNIFVTNGYMSSKALEMVAPFLDAANVDLKSFNDKFYQKYCKARITPVKDNLKAMKSLGIMVEITTLVIPGLNDDMDEIRAMASFISRELGKETPWHISRFHPSYKLQDIGPTPVSTLERVYKAGKDAGLKYVYTGNAPGLKSENTYCHSCNELLIKRYGYNIENFLKEKSKCPECDAGVWGIY